MIPCPKILCIGAFHWDFTLQCSDELIFGESNPVCVTSSPGGVAFNIANTLAHLNCDSGLISGVGSDENGVGLLSHLNKSRIQVKDVETITGNTATYTLIVDKTGELIIGLANMDIYDLFDQHFWINKHNAIRRWDAWCLDTNLPELALKHLIDLANGRRLYLVVSSPAKGRRVKSSLTNIDTLILNIAEASALAGHSYSTINDAKNAAELFCNSGVKRVIVTAGVQGAAWAERNNSGAIGLPAQGVSVKHISGVGDTLAAVTIAALERNYTTARALQLGILASQIFMNPSQLHMPITWDYISTVNGMSDE